MDRPKRAKSESAATGKWGLTTLIIYSYIKLCFNDLLSKKCKWAYARIA